MQVLVELEHACHECDGAGRIVDGEDRVRCPECDGAGIVPTELGQAILDFVENRFDIRRSE